MILKKRKGMNDTIIYYLFSLLQKNIMNYNISLDDRLNIISQLMARVITAKKGIGNAKTSPKKKTIAKSVKAPVKVAIKAKATKPKVIKKAPKPLPKKVIPAKKIAVKAPAKPAKPAKKAQPVKAKPEKKRAPKAEKKPAGPLGYTADEYAKFKEMKEKFADYSNQQLKDLLKKNLQSMTGNKDDLVYKCADGSVLGRIPRCPKCFGGRPKFDFKKGTYYCSGYHDDADFKNCHSTFTLSELKRDPWQA